MAADGPSEWDPGELLLYASEYLDMYRLFSECREWDIAASYLDAVGICVEDARDALIARTRKRLGATP
jgi:hypothetical protein